MRLNDPKFGYHWIWMIPTYYALEACGSTYRWLNKPKKKKNKSAAHNRLRELGGINESTRN